MKKSDRLTTQATRCFYCLDAVRDDMTHMLMELNHERAAQLNSPATGTREQAETAHALREIQTARRDVTYAMETLSRLLRMPATIGEEDDDE